ncbi:MAG: hypothetical protein AAGK02_08510 [Pseudomonadota bacterium]
MSEGATIAFVILTFAVVFPVFWIVVTTMIAELGGWNALQRRFTDQPDAQSIARFRWRTGQLGHPLFGVSYSGVLTFEVCEPGVRIRVMKLFGLFSRPIFLPWDSFRTEPYQWFIWSACKIVWGPDKRDALIIYRRLAEDLAVASDGRFGSPEQGR